MNYNKLLSFIIFFLSLLINAQNGDDDILFTVDDNPVTAKEFIKVYNKNLDLVKDESQKDIDAYLQLYINYQLKVQEARRLGLQNDISYQREFTTYKNQLVENYLSDSEVTNELVEEAYERVSQDIKAVHILLRIDKNDTDTTEIYNKLLKLRPRLKSEDFENLKAEMHDGQNIFVEDLGYFTGFKMVYPFETAAFKTEIGQVSLPFRTRFGYHIVKVLDKRPSRGSVTVSHIMIANKQDSISIDPEIRIGEINSKLKQGENFESLAKQFSEDKGSAKNGGLLAAFEGGQLSSKKFEDVAFSLKNPGDTSEPFESEFGWHIVKLIKKEPVPPFEHIRPELEAKVKRDSRSSLINDALIEKLKKQYTFETNNEQLDYFESILNENYFNRKWVLPENFKENEAIAKIENEKILNGEFGSHLLSVQNNYAGKNIDMGSLIQLEIKNFLDDRIISFHKDNLENINEEFAFVLNEYREGLLLFDLMEKEVWNAAVKDSVGLKNYFEKNKTDYRWDERFEGTIVTASNKKDLEKAIEEISEGETVEEVLHEINTKSKQRLISTSGIFDKNHQMIPEGLNFKEGVSEIFKHNDSYSIAIIDRIIPASYKSLEETKGRVISDYQAQIEQDWIKELRERFKVEINDEVYKKVKVQLESQNG